MTTTVSAENIRLPELLAKLKVGDTVLITLGDNEAPVARMEALPPRPPHGKRLGFFEHLNLEIPDSFFFDPLPEEELHAWEGGCDR